MAVGDASRRAGWRGILSWCFYDWANSAFNTVIGTFVFSLYFARGIYGDETAGSALWGYVLGVSGLAVALLSPVFGAIADRSGRRKPWLAVFTVCTVVPTALLWYALPARDWISYALICVALATIAFELAGVFYNAMLPTVAQPAMLGRVSGWGWGLGYIGGLACLVAALVGFIGLGDSPGLLGIPKDEAAHVRATSLLVAAWFAVFAVPLFLFSPDQPPTGISASEAVRSGIAVLVRTIRTIWRERPIVRFLIASAIYRDALATLFAVGGLYAAGTFGMSFQQILLFAIGLNVTAGIGAVGFAWLDDAFGSKRTVLLSLAGLIVFGVALLLISDATSFIVLALGLGIFVGPSQAASRSLMARLSPPQMQTEMFGLYALTGKSVAFLGPLSFGAATGLFDSQRAGMATIVVFFAVGFLLLLSVREPRRTG